MVFTSSASREYEIEPKESCLTAVENYPISTKNGTTSLCHKFHAPNEGISIAGDWVRPSPLSGLD